MKRAWLAVLIAIIAVLVTSAVPALAAPITASPARLSLSTPVGTTTEATVTLTNTGPRDIVLTGAFLTYKPFLTPGAAFGEEDALEFFTYDCGDGYVLAPGASCSWTVVFQPGVFHDPDPEPGTVFRGQLVQRTDMGQEVVRFKATAT